MRLMNSARNRHFKPRHAWRQKRTKLINTEENLKTVINLTSYQLSEQELDVLSRGLSFCPNPEKKDPHILITDILLFQRRCKLRYVHLTSLGQVDEEYDVFHPPTGWTPKTQNRGLDSHLHTVVSEIPKIKSIQYKHNLNLNRPRPDPSSG